MCCICSREREREICFQQECLQPRSSCPYVFNFLSTWSWGCKAGHSLPSHSFQHCGIGLNSSLMIFWASHICVSIHYLQKVHNITLHGHWHVYNEADVFTNIRPWPPQPQLLGWPSPGLIEVSLWKPRLGGLELAPRQLKITTTIATNDDVPQTNWLCEDWMGWTCSHMKVEVNGAWQKLSTWHAARKPDWQAEGRAENWVMQTYGPIWQDGNLKGRYRKVDHQFGLQLFIVRTKCKCWPTGSVGRRHKNKPRVQVALAYKIYARLVRGDRRMTPDTV